METNSTETLEADVLVCGGVVYRVLLDPDRSFSPKSLTNDVMQNFTLKPSPATNEQQARMWIQGDKIVAVVVYHNA